MRDGRMPSVRAEELAHLHVEITVLDDPEPIDDPKRLTPTPTLGEK